MSKVTLTGFSMALGKILDDYTTAVQQGIDDAGRKAMRGLVKETKQTAPKVTGDFAKAITSTEQKNANGMSSTFIWRVKAPFYRLTHLLVHGHAKKNGGRVPGNPFLHNAVSHAYEQYEADVEEVLKNDR